MTRTAAAARTKGTGKHTVTQGLEMIRDDNESLRQLLADPNPGLSGWLLAVCHRINRMHAVISGNDPDLED